MTEHYACVLSLHQLRARIHLGIGGKERREPQEVIVNVRFYLPEPPPASQSEDGEYICYHGISEKIHALCVQKEYRLIEYLTHEIYRLLRNEVPANVRLWVRLHKPRILLDYVEEGSSYTFTDLPPAAWVAPQ